MRSQHDFPISLCTLSSTKCVCNRSHVSIFNWKFCCISYWNFSINRKTNHRFILRILYKQRATRYGTYVVMCIMVWHTKKREKNMAHNSFHATVFAILICLKILTLRLYKKCDKSYITNPGYSFKLYREYYWEKLLPVNYWEDKLFFDFKWVFSYLAIDFDRTFLGLHV